LKTQQLHIKQGVGRDLGGGHDYSKVLAFIGPEHCRSRLAEFAATLVTEVFLPYGLPQRAWNGFRFGLLVYLGTVLTGE